MRLPVSWLVQQLELNDDTKDLTPDQVAEAFTRIGIEVEELTPLGPVTGPLVVGRVAEIEELTGFKKPIRFCTVEIGDPLITDPLDDHPDPADPHAPATTQVICGATNFVEGDLVVVALPGAVLPGGFAITSRKTYGRISNGMICSLSELGLGDDHSGILVLPSGEAAPGDDAVELLGLTDTVIEVAPTPDMGYCFSVRGLARELACALDLRVIDPAAVEVPPAEGESVPVTIEDPDGCSRFALRRISGIDPTAPTPWFIRGRLALAGIRSISLAVDVTNYVMLETGQPMHAFDTTRVSGAFTVRRARPGEKLVTLDDVTRTLDPDDIVVCDESGPISLAGVMGGASTEISPESTDILLEAAIWDPASIARAVRRHKLPSEASKRFERSVDPALPPSALERAARLLREYGEGRVQPGRTDVGNPTMPEPVVMAMDLPDRVAGIRYARGVTVTRLQQIGCTVDVGADADGTPTVTAYPPSWRADLLQPADLVEEVLRLQGYDTIPTELPSAPPGRGLTPAQRRKRAVGRALAEHGYVEVLPFPFIDPAVFDAFGLPADDSRRRTLSVLNPLEADRHALATTLLPGLLDTLTRNVSRGARDVALFHIGQVVLPRHQSAPMPDVAVTARPGDDELGMLAAALPNQPVHVAAVLAGNRTRAGWWGAGEPASWADAIQSARTVAAAAGVELTVHKSDLLPWHPGRCAELRVGGFPVGHAGELHPKVVEALGLPARTCAMELDLDALPLVESRPVPLVSPYPPVLLDVALVVPTDVPVAEVADALRAGGGDLLEDLSLFDVYTGEQVGEGKRSLAYALRFRAPDRTLTVEEATAARDTAVATATERFGAVLRA
ncbi:phenylalanine--tRNA ligase subunit beta [Actinokineospora sp. UTMC 2448]|uniref:phenylalanine--tRNA ligase subunit beta n=1 Tax=Actinokineospora sp. UTMC 2448 TaxID=2268449 RepID=UPI002164BBFA|nr:phenylalanine--tRNA ligase subunit beta [Actinokineospora sp. UTMC 2448]UVS80166.1 Phenylalanine--tRNA ligase beta subunit [Actinokineospora sp. UTMC 2448]